ncbi:DUF4468 domain-containing protein [Hymenobacter nivis]|nr:DUF4468 domain-containing protein [Hymenobacter nivis]
MKAASLFCLLGLPLAAAAQKLPAHDPPVTYYIGVAQAPLYRSAADTAGRPAKYLPSQTAAVVVGRLSPRWVVVELGGFRYLTPADKLTDYDPADADALPVDPRTHRIAYEGVVRVPGATQAELLARATAWVAQAYPLANAVVDPGPAAGQLVIKGTQIATFRTAYAGVARGSYAGVVQHTLTLYTKDGAYKYVLTDLVHDAAGTPNLRSGGPLEQEKASLFGYAGLGSRASWDELKTTATRDVRRLLATLQTAMTLGAAPAAPNPGEF